MTNTILVEDDLALLWQGFQSLLGLAVDVEDADHRENAVDLRPLTVEGRHVRAAAGAEDAEGERFTTAGRTVGPISLRQ
jgi:hypothetical protein